MTTSIKIVNEGPNKVTLEVFTEPCATNPERKLLNTLVISADDFRTTVVSHDTLLRITEGVWVNEAPSPEKGPHLSRCAAKL